MVSNNFYGSTQSRLKTYTEDRRVEERNGDIQQAKVYKQLAQERGDIEAADRLAKLGMNILGKVSSTEVPIVNKQGGVAKMAVKEHIMSMIEAGSLSNWWEAIKKIPPKNLSAKARIVQDDIKHNKMLKSVLNELVSKISLANSESIGKKDLLKNVPENYINLYQQQLPAREKRKQIIDTLFEEFFKSFTGGDERTAQELDDNAKIISDANAAVAKSIQSEKANKGLPKQSFDTETLTTEQSETFKGKTYVSANWFNSAKAVEFREVFSIFNSDNYPEIKNNWNNIEIVKRKLRPILEQEDLYLKQK